MRSGTGSRADRELGYGCDKASPFGPDDLPTTDGRIAGTTLFTFKEFVNYRGGAYRVTRYTQRAGAARDALVAEVGAKAAVFPVGSTELGAFAVAAGCPAGGGHRRGGLRTRRR
jgi:hypothetical protein